MATIRIKQGSDVTDFTDVNLESTVGDLRNRIREKLGIAADVGMKLVYGGQILKDTNTLSSYKIDDGKTIQLVVTRAKMETAAAAAAPATPAAAPAAQSSSSRPASASSADSAGSGINQGQLRALLQNPEGRRILQAMMSNPQLLAAVMQSNPELANNPEALAMLRNPEFLRMMADPDNIESNLAPSISREVFDVAIRCMNGEPIPANYPYAGRTVGGGDVPEGNGGEGEGEGEDDGDEMDTEGGDGEFHEFISRDQIRVALVEALGETNVLPSTPRTPAPRPAAAPQQQQQPPQPARESSRPRNPSSAAGAPAAAQAPAAAPAPAAQNPAVQYAAQLQQLRDMGFSDEAACLRALQATRGNVEAALGMLL